MAFSTQAKGPSWTMRSKPKMVIGGNVPSWTNSIPGPKYSYSTDVLKERQPVYTIRGKPEMVIGGNVPSWTNSIPGPKYFCKVDTFRPRQPCYSMNGGGRREELKKEEESKGPLPEVELHKLTTKTPPSYSLRGKPNMIIGGDVPSWKNSIPGPMYDPKDDAVSKKRPCFTIGKKAPTEGDIMAKRSPGPIYGGAAIDAKLQSLVDSTKKREFAPSFGHGPRWDGPVAKMAPNGVLARYEMLNKAELRKVASCPAMSDA